jgi:hypothetical protein
LDEPDRRYSKLPGPGSRRTLRNRTGARWVGLAGPIKKERFARFVLKGTESSLVEVLCGFWTSRIDYTRSCLDLVHAPSLEIAREFPPEPSAPRFEVADILRQYGPDYRATHNLGSQQRKAMEGIETCRTRALGGHVDRCDHCGHLEISYNSCRNRHCTKCRGSQRIAWVAARELELLPIQYFHLVFTLPQELLPLIRYNPAKLYDLLFKAAADTLQSFAEKKWDAKLGIIMVRHTWGQTLNEHPHVHCIVTGGALQNDASRFIQAPNNFLFPVKALSPVFRAKYLAGLEAARHSGTLKPADFDLSDAAHWKAFLTSLYRNDWVVYAQKTFDQPEHLIRYIGRYINRVAIANHRILGIDNGRVSFRYHDNRDDRDKTMTLAADEFIRRFLTHILPKGFRRIRYYGFLVNSQRKSQLTCCRALLNLSDPDKPYIEEMDRLLTRLGVEPNLCPVCGQGTLQPVDLVRPGHDPPEFLRQAA